MKRLLPFVLLSFVLRMSGQNIPSPVADTAVLDFPIFEAYPMFPGGHEAMMTFIADHLQVPDTSLLGSKIIVAFTVEMDGSVTEPEIKRGVGPLADAEALRLVEAMPDWIPGTFAGKPQRTRMVLPIQICVR